LAFAGGLVDTLSSKCFANPTDVYFLEIFFRIMFYICRIMFYICRIMFYIPSQVKVLVVEPPKIWLAERISA